MSVSGVMCGVMKNSNLALSGTNQITLELSTPHGVAPNGVLLCATADGHRFDRGTFVLNALEDGGSHFITGESTTIAGVAESDLLSVPALKGATSWNHRSVEVGVAADVLGLDARYSTSYARSRYDDLVTDIAGNVLDGLFQDPVWSVDAAARTAASDAVVAQLALAETDTARAVLLKQLEQLNRPSGNCALLTGSWKKSTRYELVFSVPNPGTAAGTALGWWIVPVSYAAPGDDAPAGANGAAIDASAVTYIVRGDVRGTDCSRRPTVSSTLVAAGDVTATTAGAGTAVAAGNCATGEARSWRHSGHCVACVGVGGTVSTALDTDGVTTREVCVCPSNLMPLSAGASACGAPRGPLGTATTEQALALELCATFVGVKTGLDVGPAVGATAGIGGGIASGAHAVAAAVIDAFVAAGSSLVDHADIALANKTYHSSMLFDERAPDDPSRRTGLKPHCQKCEKDAGHRTTFVDDYGVTSTGKDVRFDAGHALRLIGYVLYLKGYECDGLYDTNDPYAAVLGGDANANICEAAAPT